MKIFYSIILLIIFQLSIFGQNTLTLSITDSANTPIAYAQALLKGTNLGGRTDANGKTIISKIPSGKYTLEVSFIGYNKKIQEIDVKENTSLSIVLEPAASELQQVIVQSTRINRSIRDIPTRIEVLTDEIEESTTMDPSKIAHLISHTTGVQVQVTSATSNTSNVRIQGLDGKYTQILRDGMPIYGGFSGSLGITQIPPLDLKQLEFVKGSASTLYGGGAIAGLINLISKTPQREENILHLNFSHIGARDANLFTCKKLGKWGTTILANINTFDAYDADKDGFSDLPKLLKVNLNPKIFYNPSEEIKFQFGATLTRESRAGGDMILLENYAPSPTRFFSDKNTIARTTTQFKVDYDLGNKGRFQLKNSFNIFDRTLEIIENKNLDRIFFSGIQVSSFSEANYQYSKDKHQLVAGLNYITEQFDQRIFDSSQKPFERHATIGFFTNYLYDFSPQFILEAGLRVDYNQNSSNLSKDKGDFYVLPRLNILYKTTNEISIRLGGGLGYRPATLFNQEAEIQGFKNVLMPDFSNLNSERSYGGNFDFNFKKQIFKHIKLSINQLFFYTYIDKPIFLINNQYQNSPKGINTMGFETQMKWDLGPFTWFVGYTYTNSEDLSSNKPIPLTPKHSIKGDLLFHIENEWRIGADYELKSSQMLSNGIYTPDLFLAGLLVEKMFDKFSVFVNFENITDTRQTRFESIISNPYRTPQYTEIYAPLDGFFMNFGVKMNF